MPASGRFPGRWSEGELLWIGRTPTRFTRVRSGLEPAASSTSAARAARASRSARAPSRCSRSSPSPVTSSPTWTRPHDQPPDGHPARVLFPPEAGLGRTDLLVREHARAPIASFAFHGTRPRHRSRPKTKTLEISRFKILASRERDRAGLACAHSSFSPSPVRRTRAGPEMPAHRDVRTTFAPRSEFDLEDRRAPAPLAQPGHRCASGFRTVLFTPRARAIAWSVGFHRLRNSASRGFTGASGPRELP